MEQLLDDMGEDGYCVCPLAKAKARIAFGPFITEEHGTDGFMSLDAAQKIVKDCQY